MTASIRAFQQKAAVGCAGLALLIAAAPMSATNLVTNGSFNTGSAVTSSFSINNPGNPNNGSTVLPGWSTTPINGTNNLDCLVFNGGAGNSNLCGTVAYPGQGVSFATNPGPLIGASPDGGNYVAIDSAPGYGSALQQTISGLTAGMTYALTFYQAATQQAGFSGATTDTWNVSLTGKTTQTDLAPTMHVAQQGSSPWVPVTLLFKADTTGSEVLSFLAVGTPANNDPPFALLDGVSLTATPEPGTFGLLGLALLSIPAAHKLRKKRS